MLDLDYSMFDEVVTKLGLQRFYQPIGWSSLQMKLHVKSIFSWYCITASARGACYFVDGPPGVQSLAIRVEGGATDTSGHTTRFHLLGAGTQFFPISRSGTV